MNITPKAAPAQSTVHQANTSAQDSRARAIQMLTQQPQQEVVKDQTNVQPEELAAIQPPVQDNQPESQEQKPATPEETATSRQFAQLARQEKALRQKAFQQEQAFKAREEALKAKEASLQPQKPDYTNYISKDQLKQDALSVLSEAGISYEELTNQILNQTPQDPRMQAHIAKLEAKIQALESGVEDNKKSQVEQQTKAYQAAVKQIETDVKHLVTNDPSFEAIKAANAYKDVVELITETYNKDGILLTNEEAAQQVEDYLVEEYTKLTSIDKIKKRLAEASAVQKPVAPQQTQGNHQQKQQQPMKTLTNATGSTRQLSARERAVLAFKGETKT